MKAVIKYSRHGAARYVAHLDMQRCFGRAVRRAGLAAEYSQGFNPHIVMSFASPLSVGYETEGDYLEIGLCDGTDLAEAREKLNAVFPPEIRVLSVREKAGTKKLMAMNESASYRVKFNFDNAEDCGKIKLATQKIMDSASWIAPDRKGKELDIRPLILSAETDGAILTLLLKNSSGASLNPAVAANALQAEAGTEADADIRRLDCYTLINGKRVPFSEI